MSALVEAEELRSFEVLACRGRGEEVWRQNERKRAGLGSAEEMEVEVESALS